MAQAEQGTAAACFGTLHRPPQLMMAGIYVCPSLKKDTTQPPGFVLMERRRAYIASCVPDLRTVARARVSAPSRSNRSPPESTWPILGVLSRAWRGSRGVWNIPFGTLCADPAWNWAPCLESTLAAEFWRPGVSMADGRRKVRRRLYCNPVACWFARQSGRGEEIPS